MSDDNKKVVSKNKAPKKTTKAKTVVYCPRTFATGVTLTKRRPRPMFPYPSPVTVPADAVVVVEATNRFGPSGVMYFAIPIQKLANSIPDRTDLILKLGK